MSQRPVIFLSFANDADAHLDMLKEEGRDIFRALQDRHDQQHVEVLREESADVSDIFYNLNRYGSRVAIFHYGGHASGTHLRLEDQNANAQGLARLLGSLPELKLVFLNGCSTQDQVARLLENSVPAVIATSVEVNDNSALKLAKQIYAALAEGKSIEQAFYQGVALLETLHDQQKPIGVMRSLSWEGDGSAGEAAGEEMPWGLYLNPDPEVQGKVLNWTLPDFKKVSLPANFGSSLHANYRANAYLVTVLEAMAEYNQKLYGEMEDEFGDPKDEREYPEIIIKNFPWPIGSQIRILVANADMMNQAGRPRLKQLLYTYVVSSQFLSYILLAELWDAKINGRITLADDFQETFESIPMHVDAYDFVDLIDKAREVYRHHSLEPFIPEMEVVFKMLEEKGETYEAYQFLEGMRQRVNDEDLAAEEMVQVCNETEFCLTAFLKLIAFLAHYRLVTVKDINIFKPRHREALFRMQLGVLNAFDKELLRSREKDQKIYTDSHSVLVVRNLKDMQEYLNLSPFIIDKNAFAGKPVPNICLYHHQEASSLVYLSVHYNINKAKPDPSDLFNTQDEETNVLQEQFQLFTGKAIA